MIIVDNKVNDATVNLEDVKMGDAFMYNSRVYIKLSDGQGDNCLWLREHCGMTHLDKKCSVIEVDLCVSAIRKPKE